MSLRLSFQWRNVRAAALKPAWGFQSGNRNSRLSAPLQFRRSACLYPAQRAAGSGPPNPFFASRLRKRFRVRTVLHGNNFSRHLDSGRECGVISPHSHHTRHIPHECSRRYRKLKKIDLAGNPMPTVFGGGQIPRSHCTVKP